MVARQLHQRVQTGLLRRNVPIDCGQSHGENPGVEVVALYARLVLTHTDDLPAASRERGIGRALSIAMQ